MITTAQSPVRRASATTAPPARKDSRRPDPARRPSGPAAAQRDQPHRWFADRLLEVLSGRRPVGSMIGHVTGEAAYQGLWQLAARGVLRPPAGRPAPAVARCHFGAPAPDVREVFARVVCGDALRALAFRLERGPDHRWRCTAVEFAGPSW